MEYNYQLNFNGYNLKSYSISNVYKFEHLFPDLEVPRTLAHEVDNLDFTFTTNDLFRMGQTDDFRDLKLSDPLRAFYKYMKTHVRAFVENQFGMRTKEEITMTASKYLQGDYLLCHDDRCGDRHVAFVYYLTEHWRISNGGALRFFGHEPGKSIPLHNWYSEVLLPTFNSLVLFQVSTVSHHEVQEVLGDNCRLSVNGWFHCDRAVDVPPPELNVFMKSPLMQFKVSPRDQTSVIQRILNPVYLADETQERICNIFKEGTELLLTDFLTEEMYNAIVMELQNDRNEWEQLGPPNYRKTEELRVAVHISNLSVHHHNMPNLNNLLNVLISTFWLNFVTKVTNTCLAVFREDFFPPVCMVQVQRWGEGCYTLLGDHELFSKYHTVEITLFFDVNGALLGSDENDEHQRPHLSGKYVRTVMMNYGKKLDEVVVPAKMRRLGQQLMFHQRRRRNHVKTRNKQKSWIRPYSGLQSFLLRPKNASAVEPMRPYVQEKIQKMKDFRKRHPLEKSSADPFFIKPVNNGMLITVNSDRTQTFLGYIQNRSGQHYPETCFYSVSVTYVLSDNGDLKERVQELLPKCPYIPESFRPL